MVEVSAANRRRIGLWILLLACIVFTVRGFRGEPTFLWSRDFKPLYSGARCLMHNHNPYDGDALKLEYVQAGGELNDLQPFAAHYALYPPPAFFLVLPFAIFRWHVAHLLFLAVSAGMLSAAALLVANFCRAFSPLLVPILISIFLIGANALMMLAQPAMISIGLCVIGVVLLLQRRHVAVAILCFSFSLVLKPQTGAFVWLCFFVSSRFRAKAITIFAITLLLCIPGTVWVSFTPACAHWVQDLRGNLKNTELPGSLSDPGPGDLLAYNMTTLQTVLSLIHDDKHFYNPVSWGISGVLLLLILAAARKPGLTDEQQLYAIAALTCLSMLPFYHRTYDAKLLLLCFPALAVVLHRAVQSWRRRIEPADGETTWHQALAWSALAAVLCVLLENDRYTYRLNDMMDGPDSQHLLKTIFFLRNFPIILLAEAIMYWALLQFSSGDQKQSNAGQAPPALAASTPKKEIYQ